MSWTGTLKHVDLGAGQWVLTTSDGKQVALYGDIPKGLIGQTVVVDGTTVKGMSASMTGEPAVEVERVRKAN
jgi:hypothetical protein